MNKYLEKLASNDEKGIVIVDLDDTLSDASKRKHLVEVARGETPNFTRFHEASVRDEPNMDVVLKIRQLAEKGHDIVIMTGRDEMVKEQTKQWLSRYNIPFQRLYMRPANSKIPSMHLKKSWLQHIDTNRVVAALDDKVENLTMFKAHGIPTFRVRDGKVEGNLLGSGNKYLDKVAAWQPMRVTDPKTGKSKVYDERETLKAVMSKRRSEKRKSQAAGAATGAAAGGAITSLASKLKTGKFKNPAIALGAAAGTGVGHIAGKVKSHKDFVKKMRDPKESHKYIADSIMRDMKKSK